MYFSHVVDLQDYVVHLNVLVLSWMQGKVEREGETEGKRRTYWRAGGDKLFLRKLRVCFSFTGFCGESEYPGCVVCCGYEGRKV